MNFYVGDFYKNLLNRIAFGEDPTTIAFTIREDLRTCMLMFRHLQDKCKTCNTAREAKETVKDVCRILRARRCDVHANNEGKSPNAPLICCVFVILSVTICGPGSSVGIATDYGLDGPGSNPGGDEIFRPPRLALGPTQPSVNGYRVFPGGKVRPGRAVEHSPPSSAAVMEE